MPRRTAAVATALALSAIVAAPALAQPVTTSSAEAAAGWLARRMVDGERFEIPTGGKVYADHGGTLDAVLAFSAAGVAGDNVAKAAAWLGRPEVTADYIGASAGSRYAGAYAKLAYSAQVLGQDPTAFGGVDLIAGLASLQAPSGRFSDESPYPGDYSNTFSQAFAVLALERHGDAPKAAVDYLARSACEGGGFPLNFEEATCVPQVDATAMAVEALLAADRAEDAATAVTWLAKQQRADGGFADVTQPGEAGTIGNAGSTGLAAQALRVAGRAAEADRAVAFLKSLQVGCGDANAGALAHTAKGFAVGEANRATAQGVLGIVGTGFAALSAEGAKPAAPALDCPVPTTTTSTSTTGSISDTAAPTTSDTPAAGPQAQQPEVLARTGVPVAPALWLGSLMVVAGALALLLARRRHAVVEVERTR